VSNEAESKPLLAREGDTLVVSYPEVKIPLAKFAIAGVGGLIYTRQLKAGDDAQAEYDRIYAFLKRAAERDAKEKVQLWAAELRTPAPALASRVSPPKMPPKLPGPVNAAGRSST